VEVCYKVGLAAGRKSEGPPGIREEYDPHYYAAFLRDPDGNKIEFVTFSGE
jgi:catechol 2,3-dioxygenase-like lactoylglutathione lyase family enzyme